MPDRLESDFYDIDPADPESPRPILEYSGDVHPGVLRRGTRVVYENPEMRRTDGTYATGGMDGVYTVSELVDFGAGIPVQAILDGGAYEVSARNLRAAETEEPDGG